MQDHFEYGPVISIDDLEPQAARAVFGEPVYEAWSQSFGQKQPWETRKIKIRVVSVNRELRTITIKAIDAETEKV